MAAPTSPRRNPFQDVPPPPPFWRSTEFRLFARLAGVLVFMGIAGLYFWLSHQGTTLPDRADLGEEAPRTTPVSSAEQAERERKLYSVFARNHAAYPAGPQTGQVVVKEAWTPEPVTDPAIHFDPDAVRRGEVSTEGHDFYPYAKDASGRLLRAGDRAGLFLMFRAPAPAAPGGEEWIYATIDRAGAVTAAGRIASCIACHRDAPHDGLFGLPK